MMPAAEPTRAPEQVSTSGSGDVIDLSKHPAWARGNQARREAPIAAAPDSPEHKLAEWVEGLFLKAKLTLTDDDTAEAYSITLRAVRVMVDGARAQDVINPEQHAVLTNMLDDLLATPERL